MKIFFQIIFLLTAFTLGIKASADDYDKNFHNFNFKRAPTNKLLIEALSYTKNKVSAIDLGSGSGNEVAEILAQNMQVLAIDISDKSEKTLKERFNKEINSGKLIFRKQAFEDIKSLPKSDIIISINALPFMDEKHFPALWKLAEDSLSSGGVFVGTFFGDKHYLKRGKNSRRIFRINDKQIQGLLYAFEVIKLEEILEKDDQSSKSFNEDQFLHHFRIIAIKK